MVSTPTPVASSTSTLWQRIVAFFTGTSAGLAKVHAVVQQASAVLAADTPALASDAKIIEDLSGHPELAQVTDVMAGTVEATNAVIQSGSVVAALTNVEAHQANFLAAADALKANLSKAGIPPVLPVTAVQAAVASQAFEPVAPASVPAVSGVVQAPVVNPAAKVVKVGN